MKLKNRKRVFISILSITIILLLIILVIFNYFKYNQYNEYKSKIESYGFNELYNNKSASNYQSVTKLEALKVIIGAVLDTKDINEYISNVENDNDKWLEYALTKGILEVSEKDNINEKACYIDIIKYLSKANYYILENQYNIAETPNFSDYNKYSQAERINISDLVSNGIIENSTSKLKGNSKIKKGLLNKIVINFYEKFVVAKDFGEVETNKENMPTNSEEYPYTLKNVENEVYEQEFQVDRESNFGSPKKIYNFLKGDYSEIVETCEKYYNNLLNINYLDIDKEKFIENMEGLTIGAPDETEVEEYINYVKSNQIIISGNAKAQIPIIYNDGISIRVRMKLEFNVSSTNTLDNLLYLDSTYTDNITYEKNNVIYIDAPLGYVINSEKLYNKFNVIYDIENKDSNSTIKISDRK